MAPVASAADTPVARNPKRIVPMPSGTSPQLDLLIGGPPPAPLYASQNRIGPGLTVLSIPQLGRASIRRFGLPVLDTLLSLLHAQSGKIQESERTAGWRLRGSGTFFGVKVSAIGYDFPPKNEPDSGA